MTESKYQIGDRDAVFCVACGDILGNGSNYNLCIDCWSEHVYEMEEEFFDVQADNGFVPTNAPLSSKKHE